MRYFTCIIVMFSLRGLCQNSEDLIPKDASIVFSLNNISLLKKISLDTLIQYEFMEEVHSEMFDGSTDDKTLKDAGVDFNQKLNVFFGKNKYFEVSGLSFGVKDKRELLFVFDDFEKVNYPNSDALCYASYFNHLIIKGNSAVVLRVDPIYENIKKITDSIWSSRGNGYFYDEISSESEEGEDDLDGNMELDASDLETDDSELGLDSKDIINKTYWELRDSIRESLKTQYLDIILKDLLLKGLCLKQSDKKFNEILTHTSEAVLYLDNTRNFQYSKGLWYFKSTFPDLFTDISKLYSGNIITGDVFLKNNAIQVKFDAHYGLELGEIYSKLNSTKFDKSVLNYIHKDCAGFFTYNINLKEGYQQAYRILMPILNMQNDPLVSNSALKVELFNEFINLDALFETYKGSMFGAFNGVKKVKTKHVEFVYDEGTFEYKEIQSEGEEDMPVFTIGFSTKRADISDKVLKYFSKLSPKFKNIGDYWKIEDAIFNSIPIYILASKKGMLVISNDEDFIINHPNGYGKNALTGKRARIAKKSKFLYGYLNMGEVLSKLPQKLYPQKQRNVLNALKGKEGFVELTTVKTKRTSTKFTLNYYFQGEYKDSGKYLLDLINAAFILSK